jgi:hypothetical protein
VNIDFARACRLGDPFRDEYFRGRSEIADHLDGTLLLAGETRSINPIVIRRSEGNRLADIVWTGHPGIVLISRRLKEAFESRHLSGWSTYAVNLETQGPTQRDYFGLVITGRCGPPDYSRSERVRRDDMPGRFFRGLYFGEESWDGSDFFLPRGTLLLLATEAVVACVHTLGVQNIAVERLCDVMTSELVVRSTRAQPR